MSGSEAVHSVSEAFKRDPACLAAVLLSAMFALLTYFSLVGERSEMHERQIKIIERCLPLPQPGHDIELLL